MRKPQGHYPSASSEHGDAETRSMAARAGRLSRRRAARLTGEGGGEN